MYGSVDEWLFHGWHFMPITETLIKEVKVWMMSCQVSLPEHINDACINPDNIWLSSDVEDVTLRSANLEDEEHRSLVGVSKGENSLSAKALPHTIPMDLDCGEVSQKFVTLGNVGQYDWLVEYFQQLHDV